MPSGISRQGLEAELEAADSVLQQYGHEFSGRIEVKLSSAMNFSKIAKDVIEMVEEHQDNAVWDVDGEILRM